MFKAINEDRMLKLIHNFFENPQSLVTELVQNAVRAKAKNITINAKDGELSVIDDGDGCSSTIPLLTLAESAWDKEIEQNQKPAGWGLFVLYCLTEKVEITSRFGTLEFNASRFLRDAPYRSNVLSVLGSSPKLGTGLPSIYLGPNKKVDGFQISATLKNAELAQKITSITDSLLQFFPINITINGRNIQQMTVEKGYKDFLIKTTYMGNEVFIGTGYRFPRSAHEFDVIWYGIPIPSQGIGNADGVINITQGSPLTPVLPFRTRIKDDEKSTQFWNFVRQTIADYCINEINNNYHAVNQLLFMRTMSDLATQDELNRLDRFYVIKTQPYYELGSLSEFTTVIVTREDAIISTDIEVRLVENGKKRKLKSRTYRSDIRKYVGDYEQIFLPADAIIQYTVRSKSPEWLKIQQRTHKVEIHIPKNPKKYRGNLRWYKAKIVSGFDLDTIGIAASSYGLDAITIYYGKDATETWNLQPAIVNYLYSDEGDSFNTQEAWIDSQITEDLRNVIGRHSKYDLLEGFQKVSVINVEDIRNIAIDKKKMSITLKRGKREILLLA